MMSEELRGRRNRRLDALLSRSATLETRVVELAERIGTVLAVGADDVLDEYGIGHVSMCPVSRLKDLVGKLLRRLHSIQPERRPGSNWLTLDLSDIDICPPSVPACYAFYGDGRLVYVGSTLNLDDRVVGHRVGTGYRTNVWVTPWGEFRQVAVKYRPTRKYGDWAMVELRLIRRLQPVGNKRGIRKAGA